MNFFIKLRFFCKRVFNFNCLKLENYLRFKILIKKIKLISKSLKSFRIRKRIGLL